MKHNHIILHDGSYYYVFERLGIPLEAYNPNNHCGKGLTIDEALENANSFYNISIWDIEKKPYEVIL